jgi:hypothetical protein
MGGGQMAINVLTCQGIGGFASIAIGAMAASKSKSSMMDMMQGGVPLDPRAVQSLPQGPVEFTSEGNTIRIVLRDAEISINGLAVIPFGILTALHGMFGDCRNHRRLLLTQISSTLYHASVSTYPAVVLDPRCRLATVSLGRIPCE